MLIILLNHARSRHAAGEQWRLLVNYLINLKKNLIYFQFSDDPKMPHGSYDICDVCSELLGTIQSRLALRVQKAQSKEVLVMGESLQSYIYYSHHGYSYCLPKHWEFNGFGKSTNILYVIFFNYHNYNNYCGVTSALLVI